MPARGPEKLHYSLSKSAGMWIFRVSLSRPMDNDGGRAWTRWAWSRLRRIVTCIGPNQKNQPNLDLYLYPRYIFSQLLIMVSVSKYLKDTEDTPFMYLYLVRRYNIFVSVANLGLVIWCTLAHKMWISEAESSIPAGGRWKLFSLQGILLSETGFKICSSINLCLFKSSQSGMRSRWRERI